MFRRFLHEDGKNVLHDLRAIVVLSILCVVASQVVSGCDESLPPLNNPNSIFAVKASGHYVYSPLANGVMITLTIVNIFDETFQQKAILVGEIDVRWQRSPELQKTILLRDFTLQYARDYTPATGMLTISPGDSMTFAYYWNFKTDDGVFIPTGFTYNTYAECARLKVQSVEEIFELSGKVRMFEETAYIAAEPATMRLCYYTDRYVTPRECPGVPAGQACE